MPEKYTLDQLRKLTSYADVNHDGTIEFDEFKSRLVVLDKAQQGQEGDYLHSHNLAAFVWKNKVIIRWL